MANVFYFVLEIGLHIELFDHKAPTLKENEVSKLCICYNI